jgi:hypothetical protein
MSMNIVAPRFTSPPTTQVKANNATNLQRSGAIKPNEKYCEKLIYDAIELKLKHKELIEYWGEGISLESQVIALFEREDVRSVGADLDTAKRAAQTEYFRLRNSILSRAMRVIGLHRDTVSEDLHNLYQRIL